MTIAILALAAVLTAWIARNVFGTWFNHASHYSLVWGASLILFELRLIDYYPLESSTWIMIGSAWLAFLAGAFLPPLGGGRPPADNAVLAAEPDTRSLRWAVLLLSGVALVAVVQHWMILVARFGGILDVIVLGNIVYSLRITEGFEAGIPYLDSLALAASLFAGVLTAIRRRFSLLAALPLLVVIAEAIGMMGRMKIIIAVVLFLTGYFVVSWRRASESRANAQSILRKWAVVAFAVVLFALAGELVRSKRGVEDAIPGATQTLNVLRTASFITPSVYMYLTVHHGVFNQYLKRDEEHHLFGGNTFAPFYRFLSGFGMETDVSQYEKFYRTPVSANSGSYLREIHGDFGAAGIFVVPFLLGLACSILWSRFRAGGGLVALAVFGHLLVVVDLSTMIMGTRFGYWLVSLVVSVAVGWYLQRRPKGAAA